MAAAAFGDFGAAAPLYYLTHTGNALGSSGLGGYAHVSMFGGAETRLALHGPKPKHGPVAGPSRDRPFLLLAQLRVLAKVEAQGSSPHLPMIKSQNLKRGRELATQWLRKGFQDLHDLLFGASVPQSEEAKPGLANKKSKNATREELRDMEDDNDDEEDDEDEDDDIRVKERLEKLVSILITIRA